MRQYGEAARIYPGSPFIRRHVTATRGRPVSIVSVGYSFIGLLRAGNFQFDYKLPERPPSPPARPRRAFPLFLHLPFRRHPACATLSRKRHDEKTLVARSRRNYWPADFIYGVHFPGDRGRGAAPSAIFPLLSFARFFPRFFLISLIACLFRA